MPPRARRKQQLATASRVERSSELASEASASSVESEVPNGGLIEAGRLISGLCWPSRCDKLNCDNHQCHLSPHQSEQPAAGQPLATQLAHKTKGLILAQRGHLHLFIVTSLLHLLLLTGAHEASQQRATLAPNEGAYSRLISGSSALFGPSAFPSARHFYHSARLIGSTPTASTSSPAQVGSPPASPPASPIAQLRKRDRISSLHEQLNQLRWKLETELRVSEPAVRPGAEHAHDDDDTNDSNESEPGRPRVQLGAPCLSSAHCAESIRNAHCSAANFTCVCLDQHVPINASACLAPSLLGYECQLDAQCQQKVAHSLCLANKCACPPDSFVAHRKNKCLAASKLNDYCLSDAQCQLNERHSFCKWKIPNVYGTCKCPPNYKLLASSPGAANSSARCAPRLGDACSTDADCQLATSNSICRAPVPSSATSNFALVAQLAALRHAASSWPTSSASSKRCTCAEQFVWSASQLECQPLATEPPTTTTTPVSSLQDSHKYEMIVIAAGNEQQASLGDSTKALPEATRTTQPASVQQEQLDIKILESGRDFSSSPSASTSTKSSSTTTTAATEIYANQTTTTSPQTTSPPFLKKLRMSSLGKTCESRAECQLRDPHSDCIQGRCECLAPSAKCSANSTGCHKDTFQCRNGQCISWYFVCDQFPNCDDASDELDCTPSSCPREAFQCRTGGACLARAKVCDGKRDCPDASDEQHCQPAASDGNLITKPSSASSSSSTASLASSSSSSLATGSTQTQTVRSELARCHQDAFTCRNGRQCLPAYVFCNAVADCQDASDEDELLCERPRAHRNWIDHLERELAANRKSTSGPGSLESMKMELVGGGSRQEPGDLLRLSSLQPTSGPTELVVATSSPVQLPDNESPLVKTDRASIERLRAALASASACQPEPLRASRPSNAPQVSQRRAKLLREPPPRPPDECPRWAFTCANGKCRSSAILCSGVDGCGDNSDEDRCEVCHCPAPT